MGNQISTLGDVTTTSILPSYMFYINGVATDSAGNVYFSTPQNTIEKLNTSGTHTLFGGNKDSDLGLTERGGSAANAEFDIPTYMTCDKEGGILYIYESVHAIIRKINITTTSTTTYAGTRKTSLLASTEYGPGAGGDGGNANDARLHNVTGIDVDSSGNLYIMETSYGTIRKVTKSTEIINTVVAIGGYSGLAFDRVNNTVYVYNNNSKTEVYKHNFTTQGPGNVHEPIRIAGSNDTTINFGDGGPAIDARFKGGILGIDTDKYGNIFLSCSDFTIRKIEVLPNANIGKILAFCGTSDTPGGVGVNNSTPPTRYAKDALLKATHAVAYDDSGNIYIADAGNVAIRKVTAAKKPEIPTANQLTCNSIVHAVELNWGEATSEQGLSLLYQIVYKTDPINDLNDAKTGVISIAATGGGSKTIELPINQQYNFTIIVKDTEGNEIIYSVVTCGALPVPAPTISVNNQLTCESTETSVILRWGPASSTVLLKYLFVYRYRKDVISSITEAESISTNYVSFSAAGNGIKTITGLPIGEETNFAVVVKDTDGSKVLYDVVTCAIAGPTPPAPPTIPAGLALTCEALDDAVRLRWKAATSTSTIYYLIVHSLANDISTPTNAEAKTNVGFYAPYPSGGNKTVFELEGGTKYYFAVVVKDIINQKVLYNVVSCTPKIPGPVTWPVKRIVAISSTAGSMLVVTLIIAIIVIKVLMV